MLKTTSTTTLFAALALASGSGAACRAAALGDLTLQAPAPEGGQGAAPRPARQAPSFVTVEGADLAAKLEAAARLARAAAKPSPFWTAYSFDVRPGVAVDPVGGEFHGSMSQIGDVNVFFGTTAGGVTAETRNLGIFLLREPGSNAVTRMEVYNLDRVREYSGYPVYWAGRAGNEESLNFLRALAEQSPQPRLQERAALGVALHDDRRTSDILTGFVRSSRNQHVRSAAVFWLGQTGGETAFLADIVRSDRETSDLRRTAAHAIGASRDREALSTLEALYNSPLPPDVKRGLVHAAAENENREEGYAFLLRVARTDKDADTRRAAVHVIGQTGRDAAVDDLMKIFSADRSEDVRRAVIHSLGEMGTPRADARVIELARSADDPDLRRQAIHQLGQRGTEQMVEELMRLYQQEQDADVRRHILHAFSEMQSPRAQAKISEVARDQKEQPDLRRHAIHLLGERGERALDELLRIFDSDPNTEVRRQILHSLSEMGNPRAEEKLFAVARSADQPDLRRQAIHWIGELASKRSLEFLRETVTSPSGDTEVQMQAVHAISEKPAEQSVPLLIQVAKTHPNPQVRRAAIHRLGESGDPRAVEFFKQVLSSKQ